MPQEIRLTEELLPLVGSVKVGSRAAAERRRAELEADAEADELTEQINGVPWDVWLEGDPRLTDTGITDECGCPIYHWYAADNPKSATLHDGCTRPSGIHVWSGTMRAELSIGEHLSRLQFAEALHGRSTREAAEAVGLELGHGGGELQTITAEELEDDAARLEAAGDAAAAGRYRAAAANMQHSIDLRMAAAAAAATPTFRVSGGTPPAIPVVEPPDTTTSAGAPMAPDASSNGAPSSDASSNGAGDSDPAPANDSYSDDGQGIAPLAELFAELPDPYDIELEAAVFDFLPQTAAIRDAARAGALSPWSVLGIAIGRGLLRVAPSVIIPPLVGNRPAPLNLQIGIVGRSGAGKGMAGGSVIYDSTTDRDWDHKFRPPSGPALANIFVELVKGEDGEPVVEQTREAAWCDWSEVDSLTATIKRGGNDLGSELRAAISGEELGTDPKGERRTPLKVAAGSYRILVSVSVQYGEPAAPLMAERDGGTLQRTIWFGTADPGRYTEWDEDRQRWTQLDILHQLPPGQQHLTVDRDIRREVWEAQSASIASDTACDELGGHRNLGRIKIAAWAALVQRRGHISAAEWEWAGAVMEHSDRIRARLDASVRNLKVAQAREYGALNAESKAAEADATTKRWEKLAKSMAARMANQVQAGKVPEVFSLRDIAVAVGTGPRRDNAERLADMLVSSGVWGGGSSVGRYWIARP